MRNVGQDETQAGIKFDRRNTNIRYADGTTLTEESEEELKSLFIQSNYLKFTMNSNKLIS